MIAAMLPALILLALSGASLNAQPAADLSGAYDSASRAVRISFIGRIDAWPYPDEKTAEKIVDAYAAPRRFHAVAPGLYRSGQPSRKNLAWLADHGIKSILDLRDPFTATLERVEGALDGIAVHSVPMSGLWQPSFKEIDRAMAVLTDPATPKPILVHCLNGQDRTGVVIAAYRVVAQGQSPERAAAEAKSFGCCHLVTFDLVRLLKRYRRHALGR